MSPKKDCKRERKKEEIQIKGERERPGEEENEEKKTKWVNKRGKKYENNNNK